MHLVTVREYSEMHSVSIQSVYQRLKTGSLEYEVKNNIKHIKLYDDKEGLKVTKGNTKGDCQEVVKAYKAMIKGLKAEIKALRNDKDKNYERLEKLFYHVVPSLGFSSPDLNKDIIEVEVKKKKKKSRKKGKKK